eukprot:SM000003S11063  [mRNA]  locus=s3:671119:671910:+ [translate_table: standard]
MVGTAVGVWVDKTSHLSLADDVVASVTRRRHRGPLRHLLTAVAAGAAESLVRTSHDVLTQPSQQRAAPSPAHHPVGDDGAAVTASPASLCKGPRGQLVQPQALFQDDDEAAAAMAKPDRASLKQNLATTPAQGVLVPSPAAGFALLGQLGAGRGGDGGVTAGLVAAVWQLVTAPNGRQLVLDVSGAMAAQAMRAFVLVCAENLRSKPAAKASTLVHSGQPALPVLLPHHVAVVAGRALVATSVCLAICLHMLLGTSSFAGIHS